MTIEVIEGSVKGMLRRQGSRRNNPLMLEVRFESDEMVTQLLQRHGTGEMSNGNSHELQEAMGVTVRLDKKLIPEESEKLNVRKKAARLNSMARRNGAGQG